MQIIAISLLAFAGLIRTTIAASAQASVWKSDDCSGAPLVVYVDVSTHYCFENAGGASIGDFQGDNTGNCYWTTWSGNQCGGSSAVFYGGNPGLCNPVPFASVSVDCD